MIVCVICGGVLKRKGRKKEGEKKKRGEKWCVQAEKRASGRKLILSSHVVREKEEEKRQKSMCMQTYGQWQTERKKRQATGKVSV